MKLKENGKMKYIIIVAVILLGLFIPSYAYATGTGGRRERLRSEGRIEYTDGEHTVLIDSGDLIYLADEIDGVEMAAKLATLQAIQELPDAAAASGLAGMGVDDIPDITFAVLNDAIKTSQQSSAVPSAAEILTGKIAWANGRKITGTMRNNGATGTSGLRAGGNYTIPAGYTTGGTVTAASLASQTAANATAANITAGKTAWVNGQLVTGTGGDNNTSYEQGYEQGTQASTIHVDYYDLQLTGTQVNQISSSDNKTYGPINVGVTVLAAGIQEIKEGTVYSWQENFNAFTICNGFIVEHNGSNLYLTFPNNISGGVNDANDRGFRCSIMYVY